MATIPFTKIGDLGLVVIVGTDYVVHIIIGTLELYEEDYN
jgi:hypothetical protein